MSKKNKDQGLEDIAGSITRPVPEKQITNSLPIYYDSNGTEHFNLADNMVCAVFIKGKGNPIFK